MDQRSISCAKVWLLQRNQVQVYVGCRYVRLDFTWEPSGHISAVTHLQAIPDVTLSFSSTNIDQKTLAAFVLLLLLTCAQASVVGSAIWHRVTAATSLWKVFLVGSSCQSTPLPPPPPLVCEHAYTCVHVYMHVLVQVKFGNTQLMAQPWYK